MKPSERIKELREKVSWTGNGDLQFCVENIKAILDYLDEQHEAEKSVSEVSRGLRQIVGK